MEVVPAEALQEVAVLVAVQISAAASAVVTVCVAPVVVLEVRVVATVLLA